MTARRERAVRKDSHAHELRPCTRCGSIFEPTKWQRHRKSTTCLGCTSIVACAAQSRTKRGNFAPSDPGRAVGLDLADHLREVWR